MAIAVIITVMTIIGWMVFVGERSKKEVANVSFVMIIGITWISYYGLTMDKSFKAHPSFFNLLVLPIVLLMLYYIRGETKPKEAINILASRQGYWNEITEDKIRAKYANRLIHKADRIEVMPSVNLLFYRLVPGAKLITGNLFLDIDRFLKRARYTYVKELKDIEKYPLYNLIFQKVKGFVDWREIKVDYEQLLKSNDYNLEFFIMDCWELYTQGFNIGTANMEVLASRPIERHLINALDALDMESIRREAAPLFYAYMQFKGRLPEPEEPESEMVAHSSSENFEDEDL